MTGTRTYRCPNDINILNPKPEGKKGWVYCPTCAYARPTLEQMDRDVPPKPLPEEPIIKQKRGQRSK